MASPENTSPPSDPQPPRDPRSASASVSAAPSASVSASAAPSASASASASAERAFRSGAGLACGALLLALGLWLGGDAVIRGEGRAPWLALAGMLIGTPLVIAFTLRPAVFAGEERIRVRNPFRMITAPWGAVESVRSGYSTELFAGGEKYQLWAIPVSPRARKRAARQPTRAASTAPHRVGSPGGSPSFAADPTRAWADQAVDDLRELARRNADRESAQGEVVVRWAYEVIAPAVAGAVVLGILLAIG